ncbi:DUF465 domain-containing protein [Rhodobacteraceae bacterium RKSG542]|uniref:YdcH family protein n=1 Tax=Pseudovibrio flavus TaxID=2529854 RepID=UPI0012BD013D|nr:DUF465 domain-containing protein [Pseudovibrio flavus]MTI16567.1 DUF465 domain-containing protein [Pseudovibrio flavus]
MTDDATDQEEIRALVTSLRLEHRDLDDAINALTASGTSDHLQLQRLKKKKLQLRDRIILLENQLLPDIIA